MKSTAFLLLTMIITLTLSALAKAAMEKIEPKLYSYSYDSSDYVPSAEDYDGGPDSYENNYDTLVYNYKLSQELIDETFLHGMLSGAILTIVLVVGLYFGCRTRRKVPLQVPESRMARQTS